MEKLSSIFKNMRIKTKLFIVYFLTMSFTVAIIYTVSAAKINGVLLNQASNSLSASTLQIKDNILNFISSYEKATDNIIFNQNFVADIAHPVDTSTAQYERTMKAKNILSLFQNAYPTISIVKVYMLQDTVMFDGKIFIKYNKDSADEFIDVDSSVKWTGRHQNAKEISVVTLNRLIYNYPLEAKKLGILSVEIPESEFFEFIKKESLNKSIVISNDIGEIITVGGDDLIMGIEEKFNELPSENAQGHLEFKVGNEDYMMYYAVADNGWTVVSYIPVTSLLTTTVEINQYVVIVILISVTVFLVLAIVLLNLLTKRISQFAHAAHRVGDGQYDFALEISGNDEIGQLADSFNIMIKKLDVLFNDVYVAEIKQKEAELLALQAQINPHFLYNVLSSLGYAALKKNAPEIRNTLNDLADFYRFSLSKTNKPVTLDEEIMQVKTYMSIQSIRFGNMITISYDIPQELLGIKILKLTVQPFVENAINHAARDGETQLTIKIYAYLKNGCVYVVVADNGIGMSKDMLKEVQDKITSSEEEKSYGIQNVHNRIRIYFGEKYGVSIESTFGEGSTAVILLPFSE